ncbi:helix-turn-helix transcriptional regulator, partial [Streptomyces sp. SID5643]|uniref:helix-turn-helix domain-containing protein n=1 Tax=Streptomyces sp. SID5643 TaxID=2690307 RepID=UPI00136B328B
MSACPETERFAALLRSLKSRSGLSYEALARKSGLAGSTLHRYCRGTSVPQDYGSVHRLATVCGATPDELRTLHRLWALADAARAAAERGAVPEAARGTEPEGPPEADQKTDRMTAPEADQKTDQKADPEADPKTEQPTPDAAARPARQPRRHQLRVTVVAAVLAAVTVSAWVLSSGRSPSGDGDAAGAGAGAGAG